eukprot:symbB.v1.2.007248.t1/scaffold401.1/size211429/19
MLPFFTGETKRLSWGNELAGGDCSDVQDQLEDSVVQLFATSAAFAAIKKDGTVVTWGDPNEGKAVKDQLHEVQDIYTSHAAFAAVITWGSPVYGGNSSRVQDELSSGVVRIYAAECAFAAVKCDGSLVTWGYPRYGGSCEAVRHQLVAEVLRASSSCSTPR